MVIFSVQSLVDFSFVWRDSWVAASGMVTSSGLITCEKHNWGALVRALSLSLLESISLYVPDLLHIHSFCTADNSSPWDLCVPPALFLWRGVRSADACYNCCVGVSGLHSSGLNATSGIVVQQINAPLLLSGSHVVG